MVPAGSAKVTVPPAPEEDPELPVEHPATRSATDAAIAIAHRLMIEQSLPIARSQATAAYVTGGLTGRWSRSPSPRTLFASYPQRQGRPKIAFAAEAGWIARIASHWARLLHWARAPTRLQCVDDTVKFF